MEFYKDGDLHSKRLADLGDAELFYQEEQAIEIFIQICEGVSYIHGAKAAHRDLDPKNIMTQNGVIKIVDFGTYCHMDIGTKFAKFKMGKDEFAAPEMKKEGNYNA